MANRGQFSVSQAPVLIMPSRQQQQQQQQQQPLPVVQPVDASVSATLSIVLPGLGNLTRNGLLSSWLPYLDREHWWLSVRTWLRAQGLEFIFSFFLSVITATIVSLVIGPESFGARALIVASVQCVAIFFFYSQNNTTPNLPRSLDPGLTLARWLKRDSHLGFWTALASWCMQYSGSALSAVLLAATGGSAVPNFVATLRPTSLAGAVGIEILMASMRYWLILHNEVSGKIRKPAHLNVEALLAGLGYFVCTLISYGNGLYLGGNAVMYFGSAINLGFDIPAGTNYWAFVIFVIPVTSAVVAVVLDLLMHNVTGMTPEQMELQEQTERAALETDKANLQRVAQKQSYISV